jgi:2-methylcitrate dehydratase PrpD
MLRLRERHKIDPAAVESIECDLKPYPLVRQFPTRGFEGRFSMPFCLAMALVHDDLPADAFSDENIGDPTIGALMHKTRHARGSAAVVVRLRDGSELSEPLKTPSDFLSEEDIVAKFHRCTDAVLTQGNAVVGMLRNLDSLPSVRELGRALRTAIA